MAICEVYREFDKQSVIDSETGIISWLAEIYPEPGQPEIFNYSTKMADTSKYLPIRCYDKNGGAALTRESAQLAAVGEAIERYCSSIFFIEDLVLGTITDVNKRERALRPDEIALFHPKQKDKIRYSWFTDNTKICWTKGYSITKKEPILIPACMTYIPYYPFLIEKGERTIAPGISTGHASACSYSDALLRGIYEIIERDAFMISWLNQLPIPKINIHSSSFIAPIFHERFERDHLQYTFYNMTTDLEVPSIFCLLIDQSRDPPLICTGGASNIDPEKAALKALVEATQTYQWAIFLGKQG
ncbi:MAG: YcaO-like family protein, partial [Thermoproteota archaeon]|nr:YcaO-like family protein [Thermoproteota archaeon]